MPIGGWLRLELTQAGVFAQQVGTAVWVIFEILVLLGVVYGLWRGEMSAHDKTPLASRVARGQR